MTRRNETLDEAVAAVRDDLPPAEVADGAAGRVWSRLVAALDGDPRAVDVIRGCEDVLALLDHHQAGRLAGARALLVRDHLRECAPCRAREGASGPRRLTVVPWRPEPAPSALPAPRPRRWLAAAAALVAVAASAELVRRTVFTVPPGPRATVESVSGGLYHLTTAGPVALRPGDAIGEDEVVRTALGAQARLRLSDGSSVEMGERAELSVRATRKDTTVALDRGTVIVQAARRRRGHLAVASRDCTVQVTGTVFSVNSGLKGSRVSVIEGHVRVRRGGDERSLQPGEQLTTSPAIARVAVREEIAWSRDLDQHLALLAEVEALRQKWQAVEMPGLRYESRLLESLPAATVVVASIPNLGQPLAEAHHLFEERLQESATLREWWRQVDPSRSGGPALADVIERARAFSDFLGEEVVLAVVEGPRAGRPVPLLLAGVRKAGLQEFLDAERARLPGAEGADALHVRVTGDLLAVSTDAAVLAAVGEPDAGFLSTSLGERVRVSYAEGVSLFFAADLERIAERHAVVRPEGGTAVRAAGLDGLRHLVVESKEVEERSQSRAVLGFSGPRRGVASWLAGPASMGALDFLSPNAQVVAAFVSKSPALVLDDLLAVAGAHGPDASEDLARVESALSLRVRDDLAATLGGEFAFALDGPILPVPAWKLVAEVTDAGRLQESLEALVTRAGDEMAEQGRGAVRLESEQAGGRTFHAVRGGSLPFEVHYTFAEGYLVAAGSRALVLQALRARDGGISLARSEAFRRLFPSDAQSHVSALVYQDLGRSVAALLDRTPSGTDAQRGAAAALAQDARPILICAYGDEDAIRVASVGGLRDFDPSALALPALLRQALPGTHASGTP